MATADSNDASSLAVLFADVSGSTRLYETVGDALALATIGHCLVLVGAACEGNGGRVVKTIGDEVMAVFPTADLAAAGAAEMQARISELAPVGGAAAIRVGFHVGATIEVSGDVFGDSVNVAWRMAALAKGQQVILSAETAAALSPLLRARVREIDLLTVKGKQQDIGIFELIWQSSDADLTSLSTRPMRRREARIRLRHGSREIDLGEVRSSVTLGRDQQNDVVIADKMASRLHARIERRRDKFVLVDQSSNGTYVKIDGEPEIQLRREEMILRGRGRSPDMRKQRRGRSPDLFLRRLPLRPETGLPWGDRCPSGRAQNASRRDAGWTRQALRSARLTDKLTPRTGKTGCHDACRATCDEMPPCRQPPTVGRASAPIAAGRHAGTRGSAALRMRRPPPRKSRAIDRTVLASLTAVRSLRCPIAGALLWGVIGVVAITLVWSRRRVCRRREPGNRMSRSARRPPGATADRTRE
jgi:class 3 adenylate cyclase